MLVLSGVLHWRFSEYVHPIFKHVVDRPKLWDFCTEVFGEPLQHAWGTDEREGVGGGVKVYLRARARGRARVRATARAIVRVFDAGPGCICKGVIENY